MIRNIVFDYGGVIINSSVQNAIEHFEKIGLKDAKNYFSSYKQEGIFGELEAGKIGGDEFREKLGELCGKPITFEEAVYGWQGYYTSIDLRKLDYIMDLRAKGYKAYVLSNTNEFMMSWANSPAFTERKQPLSFYFDKLYLSYQCKAMKPEAEIFDIMLKDSGTSALESVFIDDGMVNTIYAARRGFTTLNPKNGEDWRPALTEILKKDGAYPV